MANKTAPCERRQSAAESGVTAAFASQADHQADQRADTQKIHGYLFFDVAEFLETFSNFFRLD